MGEARRRALRGSRNGQSAGLGVSSEPAPVDLTIRVPAHAPVVLREGHARVVVIRRRLAELGRLAPGETPEGLSFSGWLDKLFEAGAKLGFAEIAKLEKELGGGPRIITPEEARGEGWLT